MITKSIYAIIFAWVICIISANHVSVVRAHMKSTDSWQPHWINKGVYDVVMCETSMFYWPPTKKLILLESVCRGPANPGWKNPYGYYWGHAETWLPEYKNHSYFRIRDFETGNILTNISTSIGFGFGSAFVDYDHGPTAWVFGTPKDRDDPNLPRPYGPPIYKNCRSNDMSDPTLRCGGVWAWWSTDLIHWQRAQTDVLWSGANVDVGRVRRDNMISLPENLPAHRYVMATESGNTYALNNNIDGNLTTGWITLPKNQSHGGVLACPSIRYLPADQYYYTVSGGHTVVLQRSKNLLSWERASGSATPFIQNSPGDVRVATDMMKSAWDNINHMPNANISLAHRESWDHDANDADLCCESWGGASDIKDASYIVWGADGQGSSGWTQGPEGFPAVGKANVTLDVLLQSYFP